MSAAELRTEAAEDLRVLADPELIAYWLCHQTIEGALSADESLEAITNAIELNARALLAIAVRLDRLIELMERGR